METLLRDIRYGWRMLRKNPGFTIVAVIALTLGIASTTVIFSVVDGVLLRPLPYPDAGRILSISQTVRSEGQSRNASAPANYLDWLAQNQVFAQMAASRGTQANLTEGDRPERLRVTTTTASFFQVFGVPALLGRTLLESDEAPGKSRVVVLSHELWQRRYGGERNILGRDLRLNGEPHTVVGVMPPSFAPDGYGDIWLPSSWSIPPHTLRPSEDPRGLRDSTYLDVWARLKPDVPIEQARAELNGIMQRLEKQYPEANTDAGVALIPLHENLVSDIRPVLFVLFGAVGCLLLIGCANVANLQLAKAAARAREVSIRAALGASRMRLVRQLLTESVLLALIGGTLGVLLASWALPALLALSPGDIQSFKEISLNRQVLAFSLIASVLTGILFGLVPAFQSSSANPSQALGEGERGSTGSRSRSRAILITAEVSLSLVLMIGAGLMVKSFSKLMHVDPGFNPERLLVFDVGPPSTDEARQVGYFQQVLEGIEAIPGVERVAALSRLPFSGGNSSRTFNRPGSEVDHYADIRVGTSEYFATMGIPLLRGRAFTKYDGPGTVPVAVINDSLARSVFPGEDPIGKTIENFGPRNERLEVIGVVGNVRHLALEKAPRGELYQPLGQATWPRMFFAVRTAAANPLTILPAVQSAVWRVDKDVALGNVRTMEGAVDRSLVQRKFAMMLLAIFAGIAVALAAIGLYGVMSYSVLQRTREIGIRMALGAQRRDVLQLVVRQGMKLTALGVALGLVASFGLTRLMTTLLYGVSATDLATFVGLSLLLLTVALLACWLPARRASGVNPMVALRSE